MAIETTALHAHIAVSFSLQIQSFLTKSQLGHFSILHLNFAEIHTRKIRMTGSGKEKNRFQLQARTVYACVYSTLYCNQETSYPIQILQPVYCTL